MQNSFKKSFLYMMLLLALIFSAVGVTPALADDGVTPSTDAPVVVEEPVADAPVVDAPAVEEPVADAPAVDAPAEQPTAEEPAAEAATVAEILEAAPEGTEIVVLDESGEALPLASQEAAEAVASAADPYFYDINGVKYSYMFPGECGATPNCTESSTPIQAAVNAFRDNQNATGEIFILAGTYTENVYINGFDGYLSKLTGLVGAGSGSTTIDGFLNAYQLSTPSNPFTLSGITFTDWVYLNALGDVVVDDVVVTGSSGYGLQVQTNGGDVTINDSDFSNNRDTGLIVNSNGNIDVTNSQSNSNGYVNSYSGYYDDWWYGGYYSHSYSYIQGIGSGLTLNSNNGNITLNNVSASENLQDGAYIYAANGNIDVANSQFDSNGYFNSYSYYYPYWGQTYSSTYESGSGLNLNGSNGNIYLSNVSASENHDSGAYLYSNYYRCGTDGNGRDVYCPGGDIFVTDSTFDKNNRNGLYTGTGGGDITLEGVIASGTANGNGATLSANSYFCGYDSNGRDVNCSGGDIFVTDSTFDKNMTGLNATANGGYIILEGVTVSGSAYDGANLNAGSYWCGYDSNWNSIYCSGGDIFIVKSMFSDNMGNGANLSTTGDASVKCSEFTDNGNYGMDAGAVGGSLDLTSVTFTGNNGSADYNYNGTANVTEMDCNPVPPSVNKPASEPVGETVDEKESVQYAPLYIVIEQAQGQLPAALETGTFGSALKVALTDKGMGATDLVITLSFPIPASMKDASLVVMFWDGSAWVEVSGGSVVDGFFVVTVDQPGDYVLVAK